MVGGDFSRLNSGEHANVSLATLQDQREIGKT
jgi:hypothetical protein